MTNKTILIKADRSPNIVTEYHKGTKPTLKDLQDAVGGYIEQVPFFQAYEGEPAVMYCDEEGKLKDKRPNASATNIWKIELGTPYDDILVGDCIIVTGDEDFLE
jgi:hypothetical protein